MKALLQRVSEAAVRVDKQTVGEIGPGLLVLLGVCQGDTQAQADKLLQKIFNYRIFADAQQKMNLSLKDTQGGLLIVSQFTLAAETAKGLRPGFSSAAPPEVAKGLYQYMLTQAKAAGERSGNQVSSGLFGADMQVALINDGPVTFLLES